MDKNNMTNRIFEYFEDLGYPKEYINKSKEFDYLIKLNENNFIFAEIKLKYSFSKKEQVNIRFNPVIRDLQKRASENKALYFVLITQNGFFWFENDNTGRPKLITSPIEFSKKQITSITAQYKKDFIKLFREINLLLRSNKISRYNTKDFGYILFIYLLTKIENIDFSFDSENYFELTMHIKDENIKSEIYQVISSYEKYTLEQIFFLLTRIPFFSRHSKNILFAIDEIFLLKTNRLKIPRWISDLIIKLSSNNNNNESVFDLATGFGDLVSATFFNNFSSEILGIDTNSDNILWTNIQYMILTQKNPKDIFKSHSFLNHGSIEEKYSNIVVAPPFGKTKSIIFEGYLSLSNIEDITTYFATNYLKIHGRATIVVPDGFLFQGGKRIKFRKWLMEKVDIIGIIGLPKGAFSPYSGVKASIVIIEKKENLQIRKPDIFVEEITNGFDEDTFDCFEFHEIEKLVKNFRDFNLNLNFKEYEKNVIKIQNINIENLTPNYLLKSNSLHYDLNNKYMIYKLEDLLNELVKGQSIKKIKGTSLSFIHSATGENLFIEERNIQHFDINQLEQKKLIKVKKNDIIINALGSNIGKAAVVNNTNKNYYLNNNVYKATVNSKIINPFYLTIALNSDYVNSQIMVSSTGSVMPNIRKSFLKKTAIPVPSLVEQLRIVEEYFELYEKKEEHIKKVQLIEKKINSLIDFDIKKEETK